MQRQFVAGFFAKEQSKQANSFETRKDSQSINKIKKEKKYQLARACLHLIFLAEREREREKKTHN